MTPAHLLCMFQQAFRACGVGGRHLAIHCHCSSPPRLQAAAASGRVSLHQPPHSLPDLAPHAAAAAATTQQRPACCCAVLRTNSEAAAAAATTAAAACISSTPSKHQQQHQQRQCWGRRSWQTRQQQWRQRIGCCIDSAGCGCDGAVQGASGACGVF